MTNAVSDKLRTFEQSAHIEVQERACSLLQLLKYVQRELKSDENNSAEAGGDVGESNEIGSVQAELWSLFDGELNPVAPKAQRKVPVPEGLDLDAWINDPLSEDEPVSDEPKSVFVDSPALRTKDASSFAYAMSSQNYSTGSEIYTSQQGTSIGARKVIPLNLIIY